MIFQIGDITFPTKGVALKAVQAVLHGVQIETPLTGEQFTLIRDLLDRHNGSQGKLKYGCSAIVVRVNKIPGMPAQRGFWIIGDKGEATDFSIYVAMRNEEQNFKANHTWAARSAVQASIERYKRGYFRGHGDFAPCEVSGRITLWSDAHVHHDGYWSFDRIHKEWIRQRGGHPNLIESGELSITLMSPDDAAEFEAFHNELALLRVVHKAVHHSLKTPALAA